VSKPKKQKSESDIEKAMEFMKKMLPKVLVGPDGRNMSEPWAQKLVRDHDHPDRVLLEMAGQTINKWQKRVFEQNERLSKTENGASQLREIVLDLVAWRHGHEKRMGRILEKCSKVRQAIENARGETALYSLQERQGTVLDAEAWKEIQATEKFLKEAESELSIIESQVRS